ncbi:hypothetical protein Kyoto30A_14810 [Helicobacter pylori]
MVVVVSKLVVEDNYRLVGVGGEICSGKVSWVEMVWELEEVVVVETCSGKASSVVVVVVVTCSGRGA